ncbi:MAG: D-alanyl-D-alanine carboxypeptidase family protein [archaeon]
MRRKLLYLILAAIMGVSPTIDKKSGLESLIPTIDSAEEGKILFNLPYSNLDGILASYFNISKTDLLKMRRGGKRWPTNQDFGLVKLPDRYLAEGKKEAYNESCLLEPVANAFQLMVDSAKKDGIYLGLGSGYRDQFEQEVIYTLAKGSKKVAPPGGSHHHEARVVDIVDKNGFVIGGKSSEWLRRNAKNFGFEQTVSFEPWHLEYSRERLKEDYISKIQRKFYYIQTRTFLENYFTPTASDILQVTSTSSVL